MKSFIAALSIVVAVVILIGINAHFAKKAADELLSSLNTLKTEKSSDAYDAFSEVWEFYSTYFSLTVARDKLHTAERGLNLVHFSLAENNPLDFARGISEIEGAIAEISDFSSFKFTDIF